jgi:hypothetical protein
VKAHVMGDDDPTRPNESQQLRDRIFQIRLKIEQLKRGSNIEDLATRRSM